MNKKRKVLFIGWDGADWKVIDKLIARGEMPSMQFLKENGCSGNLLTLDPPFSPMLWTTIATGKLPDKHGIMGFTEPMPSGNGIRPVASISRKVKAIWNILTQEELKTHVVGWWPSHPAEPINGIMVSNHYQTPSSVVSDEVLKPGIVSPYELSELFSHLKVHPSELTHAHIAPFVPEFNEVNQDDDKRLNMIAKNIAECTSLHNSITWIIDNQEWDFAAVYMDTIDHFCHSFMSYHPPKISSVSDEDYELYSEVINSAYRYHDMMLGSLLEMIDSDTTVMLVSDHGFHSDHLRPEYLPNEPAGPAYQHRNHGVFCVMGPDIKKNEEVYGMSLVDITPTLLSLYDLPVGKDMDGSSLVQIYEKKSPISIIPSWETVPGYSGMHPEGIRSNPVETQEEIQQLIELGYIEDPGKDNKIAAEKTKDEADYNLARVYIGSGRYVEAIPILEKLSVKYPEESRFIFRLSACYNNEQKYEESRGLLTALKDCVKENILSKENIKRIDDYKINESLSDDEKEEAIEHKRREIKKVRQAQNDILNISIKEIDILLKENKPRKALKLLNKIEENRGKTTINKGNLIQKGDIYLQIDDLNKAEEIFEEVLEIDAHNIKANYK